MQARMIVLVIGTLMLSITLCHALVPRVVFPMESNDCNFTHARWNLLVVKFTEGSGIRLRNGTLTRPNGTQPTEILEFLNRHSDVSFERLFKRSEQEYTIEKREGERRTGRQLADLNLYYILRPRSPERAAELLTDLRKLTLVETAYAEPIPELPRAYTIPQTFDTPDFTSQQGYLGASPLGIDALAAWTFENGRGEDVQFIDVELCWNWTHEDLPVPFFTAGTPDPGYSDHGTAVMGEVAGKENAYGITGIAPAVAAGGVAIDIDDYPESVGLWFDIASAALNPGDVWLIELHAIGPAGDYVPMEYWQANYDAIANSTALGRICVEAGGNGTQNLDAAVYEGRFDRSIRDSMAIMVGASVPQSMSPESWTNYGSRVDVNAWGSLIVTTGYGYFYSGTGQDQWYTNDFGGTSGASPMIVGACCVAQSIYKNLTGGDVIDPESLRALLVETGAPQPQPVTRHIGPRPNLNALLQHTFFDVTGVNLTSSIFNCSSSAVVQVRDEGAIDTVNVVISSESEPAGEVVSLPMIAPGLFEGSVVLTAEPAIPGDGLVSVANQNTLTAYYAALTDSDTAEVDCEPPDVFDVDITAVDQNSAVISWMTDELSGTAVEYGIGVPTETVQKIETSLVHQVNLTLLEDCSTYVFRVIASDRAGNTAIDDNGGIFYSFVTWEKTLFYQELLDINPGWSISGGQWAYGQPTGNGGEYGAPDPTSGFTGSMVYGYNLNGDYAGSIPEYSLTTTPIDLSLSQGSILSFQRWLGVEEPQYDHATLQISVNGSTWQTIWSNAITVTDSSWTAVQYDISAIADGQSAVQIRWTMGPTDSAWNFCGWNIDDVEIYSVNPCLPPTPGTPQPTRTPTPAASPTSTRTPTQSPTIAPTMTPPVTATPSPTPTPSFGEPSATPSPNPSMTPDCTTFSVELTMPSHYFRPGDPCSLTASLCNPGTPQIDRRLCVVLAVFGEFWFGPGWGHYPDAGIDFYAMARIETGLTGMVILEEFIWPDVSDSQDGLRFYGAVLDQSMSQLLTPLAEFEFGFGI